MWLPWITSSSKPNRLPSRRLAAAGSPCSNAWRMRVELIFSPFSVTGGTTVSFTPASPQSRASRLLSPAAPRPKRKSSPQQTCRTFSRVKSMSLTKSSAGRSFTAAKSISYILATPSSSNSRALSCPVITSRSPEGLRRKVNTAGSHPAAFAPARAAPTTARCPRCRPSKVPRAKEQADCGAACTVFMISISVPLPAENSFHRFCPLPGHVHRRLWNGRNSALFCEAFQKAQLRPVQVGPGQA